MNSGRYLIITILGFALIAQGCGRAVDDGDPEKAGTAEEIAGNSDPEGGDPVVIEQCDAADYRPLIGTPVDAATLTGGQFMRAYGENDIITQEYLPRRTNVVYDAKRVVRDVYCG